MGAATVTERDADLAARMAASVTDVPSLEMACSSLCSHLGFDFIEFSFRGAGAKIEDAPCVLVSTFPAAWRSYYSAHQLQRFDPILRTAFSVLCEPIFWTGEHVPALSGQERRVFAQANQHGVKVALSHSVPGPHGEICQVVLANRYSDTPGAASSRSIASGTENVLGFRIRAFVSLLYQVVLRVRRASTPVTLSPREKDVLSLVKKGGSTTSISKALGITERTVYEHLSTAGGKLRLTGRHRIAQKALELGLLEPEAHSLGRHLESAAVEAAVPDFAVDTVSPAVEATASAPGRSASTRWAFMPNGPETFEWPDLQPRMHEFALVYQPILSSVTRLPVSCEGLLRWRHPRFRPYFSPASFIPRLEQTGAIIDVGMWVIRRVLDQLRYWSNRGNAQTLAIGVNVSPVQINQPGFATGVIDLLTQAQIGSDRLFFEITESQPIDWDHGVASYNLEKLHHHGVRIFLDDFGCGHASITNLHRSRYVHGVKIDASLTAEISREPRVAMIVRSIVRLASDMGLQVVGEGVETENQLNALRDLGVDQVQGFLFSKGVDADRLMDWTRDQTKHAAERVVALPGGQTELSELGPSTGSKRSARLVASDSPFRTKITTSTPRIAS